MIRKFLLIFFITVGCGISNVQGQLIIDEVVAVLGDKKILHSDIEKALLQLKEAKEPIDENTRCMILEQLLVQKLLLHQAEVDSLEVTDSQVESELDRRLQYYINYYGTQERLEAEFNRTIIEIKEDTRDEIREGLLANEMRRKITEGITITPSEVRQFYRSIPPDSLPYINAEVEFNQIFVYPKSSEQAILDVRENLLKIRERVINGESFATMAVIYSEDGSAPRGGDIGWMAKAELDPDYSKAAFALKKGAISRIVESSFGYHLIQCLDKTDDRIHTRHILLKPKIAFSEKDAAIRQLDSIATLVRLDSLKFPEAAMRLSQDEDTRISGGIAVNPMRGGTRWALDEFGPQEYRIVNALKVGEMSAPYESIDNKGKTVFKLIWLKSRSNPHVGNLKEDYSLFKSMALDKKQNDRVSEWVSEKARTTYIRISEKYSKCPFGIKTWINTGI